MSRAIKLAPITFINDSNIVYVRGKRSEINDQIAKNTAFGWKKDDPVYRVNLRSLYHGQVVARYMERDMNKQPIVLSYMYYDANTKRV